VGETGEGAVKSLRALSETDPISNRALQEEDKDEFGYGAIAGRVTDTLLALQPPLTLALFGPWGSGKSSMYELVRRDLAQRAKKVRLVYYDASTYGGEALKRNFISHIASELGYDAQGHPEFHRGLYESTRRTELDFEAITDSLKPAVRLFAAVYVVFLLVACLLVGLTSVGTKEDFLGQIVETLPQLIAPSAIGGLAVAIVGVLVKGATLDAEQSRPATDEAFASCFQKLVATGRKNRKFDRLVVFVDELDRCSAEDVVTTLTAIRTFLNQEHAAFVVAADRAALERALTEQLPQATPINEESPDYSSASSFFDKIFHDRIPLPPLRGPRLYEWAFDKIKDRGGYWEELRLAGGDRGLRQVLYVLIPSHVRAPRRVKVLLNGFVRNAAIAAHSELAWQERAKEIAKLTVLDTEFPALGTDLRIDPRLPELLLAPPPTPSKRVQRLLAKHGGAQISRPAQSQEMTDSDQGPSADTESLPNAEPADAILASVNATQRSTLIYTEHEQLRRYLARTRGIRIERDLLFLDRAGAAVGIDDVELGGLLDEAVDAPDEVVVAIETRDDDTRRRATQVLADMADQEFGEERNNVMTALMGVVSLLGDDLGAAADAAAGSVQSYSRDEELGDEHLAGALSLAIATDNRAFQADLFAEDRLLSQVARIEEVAAMLPRIREEWKDHIYGAVGGAVDGGHAGLLIEVLGKLPDQEAASLLRADPVHNSVTRYLSSHDEEPGDHDWLIETVYEIADENDNGQALRKAAQFLLLREEVAYRVLKEHAVQVLDEFTEVGDRDSEVLWALRICPEEDWKYWTDLLSDGSNASSDSGNTAAAVVQQFLNGISGMPIPSLEERSRLVRQVAPFLAVASAEEQQSLRTSFAEELNQVAWWTDSNSREWHEGMHEMGWLLARNFDGGEAMFEETLTVDLQRTPINLEALTEDALTGLSSMGSMLGKSSLTLVNSLSELEEIEASPLATRLTATRAHLLAAASDAGLEPDGTVISEAALANAIREGSDVGREAVADWLSLKPAPSEVEAVVVELGDRRPAGILKAFGGWAAERSRAERSKLAESLIQKDFEASGWVNALVQSGINEAELVNKTAEIVRMASRGDRREMLTSMLAGLGLVDPAAQRSVADLIVELLATGKSVDFRAATKAIPALGKGHKSAGRLREGFRAAADKHDHRLSERAAKQLAEAGVRVPKAAVKKGVWGQVKGLFR
jgi:KAP family P-loop domain